MKRFAIGIIIGFGFNFYGFLLDNVWLMLCGGFISGFAVGVYLITAHLKSAIYRSLMPVSPKFARGLFGKDVVRLMGSNAVASHKLAMRQLISSDWGVSIILSDRAYAIEKDVTLVLTRLPRTTMSDDVFVINAKIDGIPQSPLLFSKPENAVDHFLGLWSQWEIGEYFVEMVARTFSCYTIANQPKNQESGI